MVKRTKSIPDSIMWIAYAVVLAIIVVVIGLWSKSASSTSTTTITTTPTIANSEAYCGCARPKAPKAPKADIEEGYGQVCGTFGSVSRTQIPNIPVESIPSLVRSKLSYPGKRLCRKCD